MTSAPASDEHPAANTTTDFTDEDLTFFMQVHRDQREAHWALKHLRRHYPYARVIVVSDDDDDPGWPKLVKSFGGQYFRGEYLYGTESGGRIVHRTLERFMMSPTAYLFKIDTDTKTHRRFTSLPTGRCVFGSLEFRTFAKQIPLKDLPSIQGGFVGYTRQAAEDVWRSEVLLSPKLIHDFAHTYADTPEIADRAARGMVSTDFLLRYACRQLGIECRPFQEVRSRYRGWAPTLRPDEFAFTHPHKEQARRHPALQKLIDLLPHRVKLTLIHIRQRWRNRHKSAMPSVAT